MPRYVAPLRDMHFVIHELLDVEATFKNSSKEEILVRGKTA